VSKLVVEVGGGVSDNTNGEVETGDGFGCDVVSSWREGAGGGYSIGGAELATIEEKKETCARGETYIKVTPTRSLHDHGLY
jgi:hypothetical protein